MLHMLDLTAAFSPSGLDDWVGLLPSYGVGCLKEYISCEEMCSVLCSVLSSAIRY